MGRPPLPIGTWGAINTYPRGIDRNGKPTSYRAKANYRDFDGVTRQVQASGRTPTVASNNLRMLLKNRTDAGRSGDLTSLHRFSEAADLWLAKITALVREGRRSPGTLTTYQSQLTNHVLPALGELRLGEATTPVVDRVIGKIKTDVSPSTAKTCRSIVSGVMGLAVRHGAIMSNPVREVERIEGNPKKSPRALTEEEQVAWFLQLQNDEKAVRKDLPDLTFFLLATGVRIGEALGVIWSEVDFDAGTVEINHTLVRVAGEGLMRKGTKSRAGERTLQVPESALVMLRTRFMTGARLDQPLFPDELGGFRDPSNVLRALREARGEDALAWITSHAFRKTAATILDQAALSAREVADQLGHSRPSMTQDVYMGRGIRTLRAADALQAALGRARPGERGGKGVAQGPPMTP